MDLSSLTNKELIRGARSARRKAEVKCKESRRKTVESPFGKTVAGVPPGGCPPTSHTPVTRHWERQQYHRASRREASSEIRQEVRQFSSEHEEALWFQQIRSLGAYCAEYLGVA